MGYKGYKSGVFKGDLIDKNQKWEKKQKKWRKKQKNKK